MSRCPGPRAGRLTGPGGRRAALGGWGQPGAPWGGWRGGTESEGCTSRSGWMSHGPGQAEKGRGERGGTDRQTASVPHRLALPKASAHLTDGETEAQRVAGPRPWLHSTEGGQELGALGRQEMGRGPRPPGSCLGAWPRRWPSFPVTRVTAEPHPGGSAGQEGVYPAVSSPPPTPRACPQSDAPGPAQPRPFLLTQSPRGGRASLGGRSKGREAEGLDDQAGTLALRDPPPQV